MQRQFSFSVGEYYHLYNRGIDKRDIFNDTSDYNRFLLLLYLCNSGDRVDICNLFKEGQSFYKILGIDRGDDIVSIGVYVLMPNHFHILVKEISEGGISKFMGKLLTGYSMYFNKKYHRNGSLFGARFKATHANLDEYLKYLFSYIHLNPIKLIDSNWKENGISNKGSAERYLANYKYSSYLDYLGTQRLENKLLNINHFPKYFNSSKDFNMFIQDWLSFSEGRSF